MTFRYGHKLASFNLKNPLILQESNWQHYCFTSLEAEHHNYRRKKSWMIDCVDEGYGGRKCSLGLRDKAY